ncbi:aminopeptidase P family protein, partial [Rhodopseudomonas sp. BR0C11]|uniref:M24 family metallopeptidase C-terminal domain-containing protein n=1 Tax=Rhodopseudomonas sp. BR0C11 TaxID=2269370 RepID=UPI0019678742
KRQVEKQIDGAERPMNGFEALTLAPIDRRLIDVAMLSTEERSWLDAYHARVRETVRPHLDGPTQLWLDAATAPLGA